MKKTLKAIAALVAASALAASGLGQIAAFDTDTVTAFGTSPWSATSLATGMTSTTLTRGTGVSTSGSAPASVWGGTGFSATTFTDAVAAQDYFTVTLNVSALYEASLSSLAYNIRRSSTAPDSMQWQWSIDNATFTSIGSVATYNGTDSNGLAQTAVDLSSVTELQSVTGSIYLRMVAWKPDSPSATGTFGYGRLAGNDLTISGSLVAVPEPSTYAALMGLLTLGFVFWRRRTKKA